MKNRVFDHVAYRGGYENDSIVFAVVEYGSFGGKNFDQIATGTQEVVGGLRGWKRGRG